MLKRKSNRNKFILIIIILIVNSSLFLFAKDLDHHTKDMYSVMGLKFCSQNEEFYKLCYIIKISSTALKAVETLCLYLFKRSKNLNWIFF